MDMFQELKKRSWKKSILGTVIVLAIAVVLWLNSLDGVIDLIRGPQTLEEIEVEDIRSQYVETDIYFVMDCFAEYVTTNSRTNVERTQWLYYIIPVGDAEYMAVRVNAEVGDILDDICDETWNYLSGYADMPYTTYHMTGKITRMSDEELTYYYDWFEEAGFTQSEIDAYVLPFMIQNNMVGGAVFSAGVPEAIVPFAIVGLVFFLWGVLRIVKAASGGYQKNIKSFILKNPGISGDMVSADYAAAADFGGMKIGRLFTVFNRGTKSYILKNDEIAWAYLQRTTHRRNGVHTGTTYAVVLRTMDKKMHTIGLGNEDLVMRALERYASVAPGIVLGYSEDRKKAYNADVASFVRREQELRAAAEAEARAARAVAEAEEEARAKREAEAYAAAPAESEAAASQETPDSSGKDEV